MYQQISLNNVRTSPKSRDSGIGSDSAISPHVCTAGTLDLSMKCAKLGNFFIFKKICFYQLKCMKMLKRQKHQEKNLKQLKQ